MEADKYQVNSISKRLINCEENCCRTRIIRKVKSKYLMKFIYLGKLLFCGVIGWKKMSNGERKVKSKISNTQ